MVKLSELLKYDKQTYDLFMSEVVRLDSDAWWKECVMRDATMAGAIVFRHTAQGIDYWWDVAYQVERMNSRNYAKV